MAAHSKKKMPHVKRILAWVLIDCIIIFASYLIAFSVRSITADLQFPQASGFIAFAAGLVIATNYLFGIYHRIWSQSSGHEVVRIVYAVATSMLLILALNLTFFAPRPLPVSVILVGHVFMVGGMVSARYKSRLITGLRWRWQAIWHHKFPTPTRVLIVGAGEAGQTLAWRMKYRWQTGVDKQQYQIVGFIDDDQDKYHTFIEGCHVLGSREDIPHLVNSFSIDLIVVAIHNISGPDFREILSFCESTDARIKIVPDVFASLNTKKGAPLLREVKAEDILGRKSIERHEAVDFSPVTGKVVLVTGAAGSIGSEICRQMLDFDPPQLILLDNNESGLYDLIAEITPQAQSTELVPCLADVTDKRALEVVFTQYNPQVVFHAAAYKHVPMLELYPYQAVRANIEGTWKVAEQARLHHTERFVLISTDKAVDPVSVMGASKRICEFLVRAIAAQDNTPTVFSAVRFGNVLGSRGSVVPLFNQQIDRGGPVTVTHPEMTRYFMSIPEAVNLVIHAACMTNGHELFMLRMGEDIRILDLAERMIRMRGLLPYRDIPIEFTGIRPGEKLHEDLQYSDEIVANTIHPNIVGLKANGELGSPEQFLEDIAQLVSHCGIDCPSIAQRIGYLASSPLQSSSPTCLHCMHGKLERAARSNNHQKILQPELQEIPSSLGADILQ